MPYLEGVTVRAGSRYIECNRCIHLNEDKVCQKLNYRVRRTVDRCQFFKPKETEG